MYAVVFGVRYCRQRGLCLRELGLFVVTAQDVLREMGLQRSKIKMTELPLFSAGVVAHVL